MALITLPNAAEWDDTLSLHTQSDEAQEYAQTLLEMVPTVSLTEEEYCGDNLSAVAVNRPTKKVYEDITNSLKIEEVISYVHAANHRACFAAKGRTYTLLQII